MLCLFYDSFYRVLIIYYSREVINSLTIVISCLFIDLFLESFVCRKLPLFKECLQNWISLSRWQRLSEILYSHENLNLLILYSFLRKRFDYLDLRGTSLYVEFLFLIESGRHIEMCNFPEFYRNYMYLHTVIF